MVVEYGDCFKSSRRIRVEGVVDKILGFLWNNSGVDEQSIVDDLLCDGETRVGDLNLYQYVMKELKGKGVGGLFELHTKSRIRVYPTTDLEKFREFLHDYYLEMNS